MRRFYEMKPMIRCTEAETEVWDDEEEEDWNGCCEDPYEDEDEEDNEREWCD